VSIRAIRVSSISILNFFPNIIMREYAGISGIKLEAAGFLPAYSRLRPSHPNPDQLAQDSTSSSRPTRRSTQSFGPVLTFSRFNDVTSDSIVKEHILAQKRKNPKFLGSFLLFPLLTAYFPLRHPTNGKTIAQTLHLSNCCPK
jgi:hypothetical protein